MIPLFGESVEVRSRTERMDRGLISIILLITVLKHIGRLSERIVAFDQCVDLAYLTYVNSEIMPVAKNICSLS